MNFPLRTAFAVSHSVWIVVSSFSFVSRKFLISSLISCWPIQCLIARYSASMILSVLGFFLWAWFLVSVPCGQRKCLIWFQVSCICWGLLCVLSCGLSLKMFHVHLKRVCILLLWDERLYIYQSISFDLAHCSMPQFLCWYFVWKIYPFLTVGCKIPYYNCVAVSIFLDVLQDFLYVFGCSYVGCIYIYNVYVFLVDSSFEYYEVTFWVSLYGPSLEVYFVSYEYCYPSFFFPVHLLGKFVSSPSLSVCVGLVSWDGSLVGSIRVGHVFLSIQLFYVFDWSI